MLVNLLVLLVPIAFIIVMLTWSAGEDKGHGADSGYCGLRMIMITGSAFWAGLIFKYGEFGPMWLRWHLSDVTMPLFIASGVVAFLSHWLPTRTNNLRQRRARFRRKVGYWRLGLIIGLLVSFMFESASNLLSSTPFGEYLLQLGSSDSSDYISYAIDTFVASLMVKLAEHIGRNEFIRYEAGLKAERARQRQLAQEALRRRHAESMRRFRQETSQRVRRAVPCQVIDRDGDVVYDYTTDVFSRETTLN